MARVDLHQVTKVYDNDVVAVNSADIKIEDKEFLVLVGPSGCGKSTLLRMIAGLEDITSGDLLINDKRVNDVPPKDRNIAMVFQNYALYPHMSVFNNMAFGLKLRKFSKDEITRRVNDAADILDIRHLLDRKPKALSGGQRQRVAVGRAIVRKPELFLFDEPLSNLDAKLRVQMRAEISKLHSRLQATMIYVTHDQVEAMTMGDRIVVLRDGEIQQIDSPLNLYDHPINKFVAGFIGSPAMNFIKATVIKNGSLQCRVDDTLFDIAQGAVAALEPYVDKAVLLGVRPEHVKLKNNTEEKASSSQCDCFVEVIEPMGHETYVYGRINDQPITARVMPYDHIQVGTTCAFAYDLDKAHYFDNEKETAIN